MSEMKPVAYCRSDVVLNWQGQTINAAMMHPSPKGLLNPIALFTESQLKAEREKAIRECAEIALEQGREWDSDCLIADKNYAEFAGNKMLELLSTDESIDWNEKRQDVLGQNGNDGLHYEEVK